MTGVVSRQKSLRPTLYDVAALAGVSKSLVSLAVRGEPGVSDETRTRILDAADRLGYHTNSWARSLVKGRSQMVGVLIGDLHGYYTDIVRSIEDAASAQGIGVVLAAGWRQRERLAQQVDHLLSLGVDGLIVISGKADSEVLDQAVGKIPIVVVGKPAHLPSTVSQVCNDDEMGARTAMHYLASLGHRRIAHVAGSPRRSSLARRDSYKRTMVELGLAEFILTVTEIGELKLADGAAPTAVFCSNDRIAAAVLGAAVDAGLRVPLDLSVVGYDNTELSTSLRPTLTTIDQPRAQMGTLSLTTLLDMLEGGRPRNTILSPQLVVRESSGPPNLAEGTSR